MYEIKKLTQPVRVEARNLRTGRIRIHNQQDFVDLSWLKGGWDLAVDGATVKRGRVPALRIAAGEARDFQLPLAVPAPEPGQECHLTLRFWTAKQLPWAPKGHEVAWEQFAMPQRASRPGGADRKASADQRRPSPPPLQLEQAEDAAVIRGGDLRVQVDRRAGIIRSLRWREQELLASGPILNLWRAPTDNDGVKAWSNDASRALGRWLEWGLDAISPVCQDSRVSRRRDGGISLAFRHVARAKGEESAEGDLCIEHRQAYELAPDGAILLKNTIRVGKALGDLPRVGITLTLAPGFDALEWFGRGPHESYWDRRAGAALGRYRGSVDEQYVPYVVPQENGNKTDTRWLALTREAEAGLLFAPLQPIEFSVSHFNSQDLTRASHINQLERRAETILNLDLHQRGLGGASCGPDTLPRYRIRPGRHRLDLRIRPFDPRREKPGRLRA
jgi:beta-galactosidase